MRAALAGEALLAPGWYVEFGLDVPALGITDMDTYIMVRDAKGQLVDEAQFQVGSWALLQTMDVRSMLLCLNLSSASTAVLVEGFQLDAPGQLPVDGV